MRLLLFIIILTFDTYSQSFDWELSNRLPFTIPKTYIYGDITYGMNFLNGNNVVDTEQDDFVKFEDALGRNFKVSLGVEYWYLNNLTFNFSSGFNNMVDNFSKVDNLPIFNGETLELNNIYKSNYNSLFLSLGSKLRVYKKLNLGLNVVGNILISSNHSFDIEVLAPEWYLFRNGTKTSRLFDTNNEEVKGNLFVNLELSYDLQLSYPIYISPYVQASRNIVSQYKNSDINFYMLNIGFRFYYGFQTN